MAIVHILKQLATQGEELAPQGGSAFDGYNGRLQPDYVSWRLQAIDAIGQLGPQASPLLREIEGDKQGAYFYSGSAQIVLGAIKAAVAIAERQPAPSSLSPSLPQSHEQSEVCQTVFLVHGHDEALLQQVARFLEKLDLKPIVLFEAPGRSQTIIEKLESNSRVKSAVVLLTPDDLGRSAKDNDLLPRARQNVVLELGFFLGKLGRENVIALYDQSVELPSDYLGVEYVPIDVLGAWRLSLAKELRAAGFDIDMNKAL